jgi:hypothetical protein
MIEDCDDIDLPLDCSPIKIIEDSFSELKKYDQRKLLVTKRNMLAFPLKSSQPLKFV